MAIVCSWCGNDIQECEQCRKKFKPDDEVLHLGAVPDHAHFCSRECASEWIRNWVIKANAVLVGRNE